jgi:hypothetical protein
MGYRADPDLILAELPLKAERVASPPRDVESFLTSNTIISSCTVLSVRGSALEQASG